MTEKLNFTWNAHSEHLQLMFKELYEEKKHCDVTLVSDDQTQFKAHKIVLSACSLVFKKIIDNNPSQHPLIYLRGIQSYEMESILQFMYLGEGRFYYERMGEFIKVAKDLEVKEISKGVEIPNLKEDIPKETVIHNEEKETPEDDEPKRPSENNIRQRQPRNQISSDVKSIECPECGKEFAGKNSMITHYRSIHEGIKYPCNECHYQATTQGNLQRHIQSVHEGIKYQCNQCDFKASSKNSLQLHIEATHSDKCDNWWRKNYYNHKKTSHAMKV